MVPIIRTRALTKEYRRFEKTPGLAGSIRSLFHRTYTTKRAVADFDLSIAEGEFVGMIGPNGAGKTTLIKMLTGIIAPTRGEVSVLDHTPNRLENEFKRQYAVVMGQKSQLFFELTAADTFLLFKELYDIPEARYRRNLAYFVELFGVQAYMDVQVRTLSLGERMKMELIAALLHDPKVLFLDEPTIGLDVVAQRQIRAFLREVNESKSTTIILTSHYMEDIRSLCRRCVVVGDGRKLYDGDLSALLGRYQTHKRITATLEGEDMAAAPEGVLVLEHTPHKLAFLAPKDDAKRYLRALVERDDVTDVSIEEEDIGSVVERIYADRGEAMG